MGLFDSWPRHWFIPLDHLENVCVCVFQQESDGETKMGGQRPHLWMYFTLKEQIKSIKSLFKAHKHNIYDTMRFLVATDYAEFTAWFYPRFSLADRFCEIENRCSFVICNVHLMLVHLTQHTNSSNWNQLSMQIHMNNFKPVQNLHREIFRPQAKFQTVHIPIEMTRFTPKFSLIWLTVCLLSLSRWALYESTVTLH